MIISMIVAMGRQREIGKDNALLWRLPNDMKHFKTVTMGKPIIMGRKTYESFGAKPLPGRDNIVITRDRGYHSDGAIIVYSIDDALAAAEGAEEVMIIGGASFYEQMLPHANRLYLTVVDGDFEADAWFPQWDAGQWRETAREDCSSDERHAYDYHFVTLERI